jgi:hypothetical protein
MNRSQLEHAIRASGAISGDREFYIVGSQSILGPVPLAHPDLLRSMEVDIAPKDHPELEALIEGSIGELSPFHETFGFFVDGVDIRAITLPDGWERRVIAVENANTNGYRGLCLDPTDLAVSKLTAGRAKDLDYIAVLWREGIITLEAFRDRIDGTRSLPADRRSELKEKLLRLR